MTATPNSVPMRRMRHEHLVAALGVEAVRRLVEEDQARVVDEGLRELHALLHAGGVAVDLAVAGLEQADVAEDLGGALAGGGAREAADLGHVGDELRGGGVRRQAIVLRHVADELAQGGAVAGHVEAHHLRGAGGRLEQAEEKLDEGALAGAVRADEADDAGRQLKVEGVERGTPP